MGFSPKLLTIAIILALAVTALPAPASAQPPPLPHAFYGEVTVNGEPAPAGTTVEARGEGVRTGIEGNPLTVTELGKYGGAGGFDPKLVVQGSVENGTPLHFFVDGVQAQCAQPGGAWTDSYAFEAGGITELDLRVGAVAVPTATRKAATAELAATQAASPTREATRATTPTTRATVTPTATTQSSPTRGATVTLAATRQASPTTEATVAPIATERPSPTTVATVAPTATEEGGLALTAGRSPEPANTPSSEESTTSSVGWILAIVFVVLVAGLFAWFKMRSRPSQE